MHKKGYKSTRDSFLATNSVAKPVYQCKQRKKLKERLPRCKSQNTQKMDDSSLIQKRSQCSTHRMENPQMYHTLQPNKLKRIEEAYKKAIEEIEHSDGRVGFAQFEEVVLRMKRLLSPRQGWSQQQLLRTWNSMSRGQTRMSLKNLFPRILNISDMFAFSQEFPRGKPKTAKCKASRSKKLWQKDTEVQPKQPRTRKSSKSLVKQKQNIETNSRPPNNTKSRKQGQAPSPELQVIVKIQEGVSQRLFIYPDTCLSALAMQFGAKYRLPNCKVVMLRNLIRLQLKNHLTQITEESADHYISELSAPFHTLNYDEV